MGIWVVAALTFKEAARKKIMWAALLAGFGFLVLFGLAENFQTFRPTMPMIVRRQIVNTQFTVGLYALNFLVLAMTVLTSVDTLSGEITSGTIQAVATKPIRRHQLLLGKWAGFAAMMTLFLVMMVSGLATVHFLMTHVPIRHLVKGVALMWLESVLLLNLTFLFGTSFSTLTNGVIALGLHGMAFLGGWIEQIGLLSNSQRVATVGVLASVIMPSESLWRKAASEIQSPIVSALGASPFGGGATPSAAMVVYAALYAVGCLGLALRLFGKRDL